VQEPGRVDRLLVLALVGLGLVARQGHQPGLWCSSNDAG
jgi:hypothetical protein